MRLRTISSFMFVLFFISCSSTVRVVERYPSNQKKVEEVISGKDNRLKIKKRIKYHVNGSLMSEEELSNNKRHGFYISYYDNTNTKAEGNYKNNKRDGKWIWYSKKGKIDSIFNYKSGLLNGESKIFINGSIVSRSFYKENVLEGKYNLYYPNGKNKTKGHYMLSLIHI